MPGFVKMTAVKIPIQNVSGALYLDQPVRIRCIRRRDHFLSQVFELDRLAHSNEYSVHAGRLYSIILRQHSSISKDARDAARP